MTWMVTPAALILWTTAALALAVAWMAHRHDPFPGRDAFACLMLAVAEWALLAGLEAAAIPLSQKIILSTAEYIGLAATPVLFLIFSAKYSGRDRWLRKRRWIALWLTALFPIGLASTNGLHHWLWAQYLPGPLGSNSVVFVHGPAYYAVAAQVYLFVLAGCVLVAQSAHHRAGPRRRQALVILLASSIPLIAGILYIVDVSLVPGLDLIPVSFFMTGFIFLIGIGWFRVFDPVPAARNALVEQTSDAVIVADDLGRVVDANPTAMHWFSKDTPLVGRHVAEVFSTWPQLHSACAATLSTRVEVTLSEDPLRHVDAHVTAIREPQGQTAGCFVVLRDITTRYMDELQLQRANEQLAEHVKQIEALHSELHERAIRDGLTGLFNRRYLDEILPRELGRVIHEEGTLTAVMIDIDHFKSVNDLHGHREGDRLLKLLGSILKEGTRPSDVACRYGGEEFLLLLPDAVPQVARGRMEALRATYTARLRSEGFASPPTLSAGIAAFPLHARSDDELLRAADSALYRAKAEGRDRVCIAPDLTEG